MHNPVIVYVRSATKIHIEQNHTLHTITFILKRKPFPIHTSLADPWCLFRRTGEAPSSASFFALGVFGLMAAKATRPGVLGVRRAFRGDRLLNLKNYFRMSNKQSTIKILWNTNKYSFFLNNRISVVYNAYRYSSLLSLKSSGRTELPRTSSIRPDFKNFLEYK